MGRFFCSRGRGHRMEARGSVVSKGIWMDGYRKNSKIFQIFTGSFLGIKGNISYHDHNFSSFQRVKSSSIDSARRALQNTKSVSQKSKTIPKPLGAPHIYLLLMTTAATVSFRRGSNDPPSIQPLPRGCCRSVHDFERSSRIGSGTVSAYYPIEGNFSRSSAFNSSHYLHLIFLVWDCI